MTWSDPTILLLLGASLIASVYDVIIHPAFPRLLDSLPIVPLAARTSGSSAYAPGDPNVS